MANNTYVCDNCGHTDNREALPPAKDLLQRLTVGYVFTDKECPKCGALCFPLFGNPQEKYALTINYGDINDIFETLKKEGTIPQNTKLEEVCTTINTQFDCAHLYQNIEGFIIRKFGKATS